LPGTFNAIWIGSLAKSLSRIDKPKLEKKGSQKTCSNFAICKKSDFIISFRLDFVIITMNIIFIACCVIALSILGKRSLRKAMAKLRASKMEEPDPNQDLQPDSVSSSSSQGKGKFYFFNPI
jgi:hypothetical protein